MHRLTSCPAVRMSWFVTAPLVDVPTVLSINNVACALRAVHPLQAQMSIHPKLLLISLVLLLSPTRQSSRDIASPFLYTGCHSHASSHCDSHCTEAVIRIERNSASQMLPHTAATAQSIVLWFTFFVRHMQALSLWAIIVAMQALSTCRP